MLPSLFRLYSTSAYSCFVIGVPILERSIGELVAHGACKSANHGTALLRDLITSEELAAEIGHGAAQVLRSFFSPVQVNARNIVWHGFMSATEWDQRYSALLLLLLLHVGERLATVAPAAGSAVRDRIPHELPLTTPTMTVARRGRSLWAYELDGAMVRATLPLLLHATSPQEAGWSTLCEACSSSQFVRPGHVAAVRAAFDAYTVGDFTRNRLGLEFRTNPAGHPGAPAPLPSPSYHVLALVDDELSVASELRFLGAHWVHTHSLWV